MKKKIILGVLAVLCAGVIGGVKVKAQVASSVYPMATIVTETDFETDTVTLTCGNGNQFQFTGIEDWFVGDVAACIMDDNATEIVTDDSIVSVYYAGYCELFEQRLEENAK